MMMFADTKNWARIQKLEDKDSLQYDVDMLVEFNGYSPSTQKNHAKQNNAYWARPTNKIYHEH